MFAEDMSLFDFARTHDAEFLPPVPEEQILRFEVEHGLKLPPELRRFYLAAGGTNEFTEWSWRIWPFEELVTIESRAGASPDIECLSGYENCPALCDYLAFIDVLIEAPLYAVCANPANSKFGEVISLAGDNQPFLTGPIKTLSDFVSILTNHWNDVVLPDVPVEATG
ncbi:MAG: SMI1/KNR4 family protein [Luteolibacter sp.]